MTKEGVFNKKTTIKGRIAGLKTYKCCKCGKNFNSYMSYNDKNKIFCSASCKFKINYLNNSEGQRLKIKSKIK